MTQSYGKYWTEAMLADLERLFRIPASSDDYMTVGEIASYLHAEYHGTYPGVLNRNTVMSKIHSTGLNQQYPRKVNTAHNLGPSNANNTMSAKRKPGVGHANPIGRTNVAVSKEAKAEWREPAYEPTANNVPMLDADDTQCRWPVGMLNGVTIACGCTRMRGSLVRPPQYCAHHMREASGGPQVLRKSATFVSRARPAPRWT